MHPYIHACTHTYIGTYRHIYMYTCMHLYIFTYLHIYTNANMHLYILYTCIQYIFIHIHTWEKERDRERERERENQKRARDVCVCVCMYVSLKLEEMTCKQPSASKKSSHGPGNYRSSGSGVGSTLETWTHAESLEDILPWRHTNQKLA